MSEGVGATVKPTVPEVMRLVDALYSGKSECNIECGNPGDDLHIAGNGGGHFHIVLSDGNTAENYVACCLARAKEEDCQTCVDIGEKLIQMSETQRLKIYKGHV